MNLEDLKEGDICLFECSNGSTFIAKIILIIDHAYSIFFTLISTEEGCREKLSNIKVYDAWPFSDLSITDPKYRAYLWKKENPGIDFYNIKAERESSPKLIKIF